MRVAIVFCVILTVVFAGAVWRDAAESDEYYPRQRRRDAGGYGGRRMKMPVVHIAEPLEIETVKEFENLIKLKQPEEEEKSQLDYREFEIPVSSDANYDNEEVKTLEDFESPSDEFMTALKDAIENAFEAHRKNHMLFMPETNSNKPVSMKNLKMLNEENSFNIPSALNLVDDVSESSSESLEEPTELDTAPVRKTRYNCYRKSGKMVEHRTYPRSYEHAGFEASLPREWDWRNVSGVNFCSPTRNQHIPVYCGSCWVFGSLGALNDRFNIGRKNRWPITMLSPQEIINCNGKGNCQGGEVTDVYEHAKSVGLVEEGCNNYRAVNGHCDPYNRCGTCWTESCDPVKNYTRYYITDFGSVSGRENMMAEIHNRGPIACAIGATPTFDFHYAGGIYNEFSDTSSNHIVSVTGWGVDPITNIEYWIVRNSWGEAWGERGWFRVVTSLYKNGKGDLYNMGIERDCYFADPDVSNLD